MYFINTLKNELTKCLKINFFIYLLYSVKPGNFEGQFFEIFADSS